MVAARNAGARATLIPSAVHCRRSRREQKKAFRCDCFRQTRFGRFLRSLVNTAPLLFVTAAAQDAKRVALMLSLVPEEVDVETRVKTALGLES